MEAETRIFGIRHHGPGCARSLRRALEAMQPDCLLVEGPPDAEAMLPHLTDEGMKPPVALLIYVPDEPSRCVYYPFAAFSPEWQAIDYGLRQSIQVRFMDLPQEHRLAMEASAEDLPDEQPTPGDEPPPGEPQPPPAGAERPSEQQPAVKYPSDPSDQPQNTGAPPLHEDPMSWIAEAAGYSDGETWWEHMVEQRRDDTGLFEAVQEIMVAMREAAVAERDPDEDLREAWMRQTIRAAQKEGFQRIAVVCGAWHGPALVGTSTAKADAQRLKGLPRVKVAATWVPWTYGRLTTASGYGAGIPSPAWYEQIWRNPECAPVHWLTTVAQLLREEDLGAPPASVIEAVRLAESLAAVRQRHLVGLSDLWEAAQAVFCFGSDVPMRLIRERLVVGERLGAVGDSIPALPVQVDLRNLQKRLRLPPEAAYSDKDLDLRKATDLERSVLLHRLRLLDLPWGEPQGQGRGKGTFHELWRLQWRPEFEILLIEANVYGNTVEAAAARKAREACDRAALLADVTDLLQRVLLADLPEVMAALMSRLESLAAATSDVPHLMDALPALVNVLRYGNVRQTDTGMVGHAVDGLLTRICIGLPAACTALNDEAAEEMYKRIVAVNESVRLVRSDEHIAAWNGALARLADLSGLHGLVDGRCCRLLLEGGVWTQEEIGRRMGLALSAAEDPSRAAAWIDGLLRDAGDILVHTDSLWPLLDRWVAQLNAELFPQLLPLLRRTFSGFPAPLRRQLGERAREAGSPVARTIVDDEIDTRRAEKVLPLAAMLLGLGEHSSG